MLSIPQNSQLILACHITNVFDVNRTEILPDDDYSLVEKWAASVQKLKLQGIIFHNNFSAETCAQFENDYVQFVRIEYDINYSPNVYRYFIYNEFIEQQAKRVSALFVTDIADVEVICNPFNTELFAANEHTLFCGDEPKQLDNDWMQAHAAWLRERIPYYAAYETNFANETLLNCGIIGGHIAVMKKFINQLSEIHLLYNKANKSAYTGDMGAFNYLARTAFNKKLIHGFPVNTIFKAYEFNRTDCWFRHK